MKEAEPTEFVLTEKDQHIRNEMLEIQSKPLATQKFLHFTDAIRGLSYCALIVAKKEDKISLIERIYTFRFGNNGLFINSVRSAGITYQYKGRASQRLNVWSGNQFKDFKYGQNGLMNKLAEYLDSPGKDLVNHKVINMIATKGMYGYIMAGNITNVKEAMQYYIRYSLRGTGVSQDSAMNLYNYLNLASESYTLLNALRVATYPNAFLQKFRDDAAIFGKGRLIRNSQSLIRQLQALGEKIDWTDPNLNLDEEAERLSKKEKRIKEFLQLWEGGPVLKANDRSVNQFESIGLPF